MSAEMADSDVAKQLEIKSGHPILVIDRDYFSTEGDLVQVTRSRYRLDHYQYTINVSRLVNGSAEKRDLVGYLGANVSA
jgi:DNA-binding GntR family transcriptional regulator